MILNCMQAVCGCVPFGKPYLGRWFGMWMKLLKDGSRNKHGTFFLFYVFFFFFCFPYHFLSVVKIGPCVVVTAE